MKAHFGYVLISICISTGFLSAASNRLNGIMRGASLVIADESRRTKTYVSRRTLPYQASPLHQIPPFRGVKASSTFSQIPLLNKMAIESVPSNTAKILHAPISEDKKWYALFNHFIMENSRLIAELEILNAREKSYLESKSQNTNGFTKSNSLNEAKWAALFRHFYLENLSLKQQLDKERTEIKTIQEATKTEESFDQEKAHLSAGKDQDAESEKQLQAQILSLKQENLILKSSLRSLECSLEDSKSQILKAQDDQNKEIAKLKLRKRDYKQKLSAGIEELENLKANSVEKGLLEKVRIELEDYESIYDNENVRLAFDFIVREDQCQIKARQIKQSLDLLTEQACNRKKSAKHSVDELNFLLGILLANLKVDFDYDIDESSANVDFDYISKALQEAVKASSNFKPATSDIIGNQDEDLSLIQNLGSETTQQHLEAIDELERKAEEMTCEKNALVDKVKQLTAQVEDQNIELQILMVERASIELNNKLIQDAATATVDELKRDFHALNTAKNVLEEEKTGLNESLIVKVAELDASNAALSELAVEKEELIQNLHTLRCLGESDSESRKIYEGQLEILIEQVKIVEENLVWMSADAFKVNLEIQDLMEQLRQKDTKIAEIKEDSQRQIESLKRKKKETKKMLNEEIRKLEHSLSQNLSSNEGLRQTLEKLKLQWEDFEVIHEREILDLTLEQILSKEQSQKEILEQNKIIEELQQTIRYGEDSSKIMIEELHAALKPIFLSAGINFDCNQHLITSEFKSAAAALEEKSKISQEKIETLESKIKNLEEISLKNDLASKSLLEKAQEKIHEMKEKKKAKNIEMQKCIKDLEAKLKEENVKGTGLEAMLSKLGRQIEDLEYLSENAALENAFVQIAEQDYLKKAELANKQLSDLKWETKIKDLDYLLDNAAVEHSFELAALHEHYKKSEAATNEDISKLKQTLSKLGKQIEDLEFLSENETLENSFKVAIQSEIHKKEMEILNSEAAAGGEEISKLKQTLSKLEKQIEDLEFLNENEALENAFKVAVLSEDHSKEIKRFNSEGAAASDEISKLKQALPKLEKQIEDLEFLSENETLENAFKVAILSENQKQEMEILKSENSGQNSIVGNISDSNSSISDGKRLGTEPDLEEQQLQKFLPKKKNSDKNPTIAGKNSSHVSFKESGLEQPQPIAESKPDRHESKFGVDGYTIFLIVFFVVSLAAAIFWAIIRYIL